MKVAQGPTRYPSTTYCCKSFPLYTNYCLSESAYTNFSCRPSSSHVRGIESCRDGRCAVVSDKRSVTMDSSRMGASSNLDMNHHEQTLLVAVIIVTRGAPLTLSCFGLRWSEVV
eukprot:GHVN01065435.1.p1 GENE.GHVN01065435.1~~GHVN01065435.1.p1  ORF type:complete len:114 (-),score=0.44 GHVN01065435.1:466-807(-)